MSRIIFLFNGGINLLFSLPIKHHIIFKMRTFTIDILRKTFPLNFIPTLPAVCAAASGNDSILIAEFVSDILDGYIIIEFDVKFVVDLAVVFSVLFVSEAIKDSAI